MDQIDDYWIFPEGLVATKAAAHSIAVTAAIFRLSEAAHSQSPFSRTGSALSETMIWSCPAAFTLLGASSAAVIILTCSPFNAKEKSSGEILRSNSRKMEAVCPWNVGA